MKKWMAAVFVMMLMLCFGGIENVKAAEPRCISLTLEAVR